MQRGHRPTPRLEMVETQYRRVRGPILALVDRLRAENPGRTVAVIVPEIVKERWWRFLLHTHRAWRLRAALRRYGGSRLVIISIPWYLDAPRIADGFDRSEIGPYRALRSPRQRRQKPMPARRE